MKEMWDYGFSFDPNCWCFQGADLIIMKHISSLQLVLWFCKYYIFTMNEIITCFQKLNTLSSWAVFE